MKKIKCKKIIIFMTCLVLTSWIANGNTVKGAQTEAGSGLETISSRPNGLMVTWNKNPKVSGYELQASTSIDFPAKSTKILKVPSAEATSETITGLLGNKKYYVRIRTYKNVLQSGIKTDIYSEWSEVQYANTSKVDYNSYVNKIKKKIIKSGMSDFEKTKAIHDWLVYNINYDYESYTKGKAPKSSLTVKGTLTGKKALCEGYALSFEALAKSAGLEVKTIYGTSKSKGTWEDHAWNQVKVNGKWYNIDVTWDDSNVAGMTAKKYNNMIYSYFLVPDKIMNKDHKATTLTNVCKASSLEEKAIKKSVSENIFGKKCTFVKKNAEIKKVVKKGISKKWKTYRMVYKCSSDAKASSNINKNLNSVYNARKKKLTFKKYSFSYSMSYRPVGNGYILFEISVKEKITK